MIYDASAHTQENVAAACAIATDLQMPQMLDSIDGWLEIAHHTMIIKEDDDY